MITIRKRLKISLLLMSTLAVFAQNTFKNPILSGFYPDPSICRVGSDYYMVTSSFEWFPGLPLFHSNDLVNWEQIGHALTRPSQLQLKDGLHPSNGLWAPTIRYHNGTYIICTASQAGGNFLVTAQKPEGPYSEPVFIPDAPGIDPSLFFEDDGTVWYADSINGDDKIPPRKYPLEDRIYIQQLDTKTGTFIGERHIVTSGYATNSPFTEAPHIYKINGKYYLIVAEGGTWEDHAVTVFTSSAVTGPYTPLIANPVLTHRHLGRNIDITTIGHADLVQTQFGDWYAVMLGVRPIKGYNMLGRETFLTRVEFQGDQPVFNPGIGRVLAEDRFPRLPYTPVKSMPVKDNFDNAELDHCWNFLRTPVEKWYTLEKGVLTLPLRPQTSTEQTNPSLIAWRVQHHRFTASTALKFTSVNNNEEAGMIIMQNNRYQYRFTVGGNNKQPVVRLLKVENGHTNLIAKAAVKSPEVTLNISGNDLEYTFAYSTAGGEFINVGGTQDGTICSSNKAGGFIGPYIGMYASSNGEKSKNKAVFDWFSYDKDSN